MSMIKLKKGDKIIERTKDDYDKKIIHIEEHELDNRIVSGTCGQESTKEKEV